MRSLILIIAVCAAACAAEPDISSASQQLCQLNPLTGRRYTLLELGTQSDEDEALAENPDSDLVDANCHTSIAGGIASVGCYLTLSNGLGLFYLACAAHYQQQADGSWTYLGASCSVGT